MFKASFKSPEIQLGDLNDFPNQRCGETQGAQLAGSKESSLQKSESNHHSNG